MGTKLPGAETLNKETEVMHSGGYGSGHRIGKLQVRILLSAAAFSPHCLVSESSESGGLGA